MNNDREVKLSGKFKMIYKDFFLKLSRGLIVVIIETDFAYCDRMFVDIVSRKTMRLHVKLREGMVWRIKFRKFREPP